jgi:REP-associated tyrosine transposase
LVFHKNIVEFFLAPISSKTALDSGMPRKASIDAHGGLHAIIVRGIDRCDIVRDAADIENFLSRLARLLDESLTACLARALMGNHARLLFRAELDTLY